MIARLLAWWRKRRINLGYAHGYAWAAGELLSGRMKPEEIEDQCDRPFDYDKPFDYGALDAVRDWRSQGRG